MVCMRSWCVSTQLLKGVRHVASRRLLAQILAPIAVVVVAAARTGVLVDVIATAATVVIVSAPITITISIIIIDIINITRERLRTSARRTYMKYSH